MEEPKILYETPEYFLLYKPPFWSCTTNKNLSHYKEYPLHNKLIILYILFKLNNRFIISDRKYPVGLMNRLDMETSGVVFVAKNQVGYDKLFKIIHTNKENICKIYLCLANNSYLKSKNIINKPINCNEKITFRKYDAHCFVTNKKNDKYKAKSLFYKIGSIRYKNKDYTLFFVRIYSGKKHQIRIHALSVGNPLVSDPKYIDKETLLENKKLVPRLFLHNIYYKYKYDGEEKEIMVPLEKDLLKCLEKLGINHKYLSKIPDELKLFSS
jgi:23S rRNA-/tRNA-specific pseudouridylate synthase